MRLGVVLPNWVGDMAMATPALRALRRKFLDGRLIGVLRPHLTDVLAGTNFLDELIFHDPRSDRAELRSRAVAGRLRAAHLDVVVLFTQSLRTALLAWASGARRRVGFVRNLRGWLLTDRLHQPRVRGGWLPSPVLDDYLRLAYALGCAKESPRIELATTPADERAADAAFQRLGIERPVVALNRSGAFGAAKLWPEEYFAELARRIASRQAVDVVFLCGPNERDSARAIASRAAHPRVFSLADFEPGIGLTKAVVRRSRLLVSTDSGPRHFAAAFDVPVITLFGPTHPAWSETHYSRAIHLQREVPCGPCQRRVCPFEHHRCMRELSVDQVDAAVCQAMGESWTAQVA
jgi:heptosyltransferase-2